MKYFYCGRLSREGILIMNQAGIARITREVCEAKVEKGRCPQRHKDPRKCKIYQQEVLDEQ